MARLPYLSKEDLAPQDRDIDRPENNLYRVLAHSPKCSRVAQAMAQFVFTGSGLDTRLKELAIMAVGYLNRVPYLWAHHIVIAGKAGIADGEMRSLVDYLEGRPHGLDRRACLAVEAAREMTNGLAMSESTFAALHESIGREALVDLLVIIAHYNAMSRVLTTLEVDIEPDFRPAMGRLPLPA